MTTKMMMRGYPSMMLLCACLAPACGDDAGTDDPSTSSSDGSSSDDAAASTDDDSTDDGTSTTDGSEDTGSSSGDTSTDTGGDDSGSTGSTGADDSSSGAESTESTDGEESSSGGEQDPEVVTIYDIQDGTVEDGTLVEVLGVVVTGITDARTGMFVQEIDGGENSGLFVSIAEVEGEFSVGDVVDVVGVRGELNELTQIVAEAVTPTGAQSPVEPTLLSPDVLVAPETAEAWEGVFVRIEGEALPVVEVFENFSEFRVGVGEGQSVFVDNYLFNAFEDDASFPSFGLDASFTAVQGPLNYTYGDYKIAPRQATDLEGYEPGPPTPADTLSVGDVVITEVMYNPWSGQGGSDDNREWIEVLNPTASAINLRGLRVLDSGNNDGLITVDVVVDPGQYVVLAHGNGANWPYETFAPAAFYGTGTIFNNGNDGDAVEIWNSTERLDGTSYRSDTPDDGRSLQLDPTRLDPEQNDEPSNWCLSSTEIEDVGFGVDRGSPGVVNPQSCVEPE